jgi:release factor glutamine methyltransferase
MSGPASSQAAVADTWRTARAEVERRLAGAGVANAPWEARVLVEEVSGYGAEEWPVIADRRPPDRAAQRLRTMTERRAAGEPLQYVVGAWSFRGLDLMVDPRVLIPRPETEWVVELALETAVELGLRRGRPQRFAAAAPSGVVVDLGTGSGAIALALEAELPDVEVWATDARPEALEVAHANLAGCGATRVRLACGNWYDALPDSLWGRCTLVVSNPPYVATTEHDALPEEVRAYEPHSALFAGRDGLDAVRIVVADAPAWLASPGALVCEIAPAQAAAVIALARDAGFREAVVHPDLTGRPRVLVARCG